MVMPIARYVRRSVAYAATRLNYRQSTNRIASDAQEYWADQTSNKHKSNSHWKGSGGLSDTVWTQIGQLHRKFVQDAAASLGVNMQGSRILEWGCGGGANAVQFVDVASEYLGVEVSPASLKECAARLSDAGYQRFIPILVDMNWPQKSLELIRQPVDIYICTYVFELIPTVEYGAELVRIAFQHLRAGGLAVIQIKYSTHKSNTRGYRWGYRRNLANMTTYSIDQFWLLTESVGFKPVSISLKPYDALVNDERYAYFVLQKPGANMD
ncbi:class I SAM-dependent methyltransferase [Brucella oryzae]|uniref:SAM-dependent methyltransferase n=1 Tax=Brucella oryzae TaxID=335286 RepID=A0A2S7J5N5_9HYPH|nr:class I SAM-dependent methyltransferase [Brucella oryzae]PQA75536.1 SAM-dependent methyltransferase [Brucella oryzae]